MFVRFGSTVSTSFLLREVLLVILIDCMIFLSPFLAVFCHHSFSCNSMPCSGCSALHRVNLNLKKKQKRVCIFYFILVGSPSSRLIFSDKTRGEQGVGGILKGQNPLSVTNIIC